MASSSSPVGGAGHSHHTPPGRVYNAEATAALLTACSEGHANLHKEVSNALSRGADPNARDDRGFPVLFLAASQLDTQTIKDLIARGADPNITIEDDREKLDVLIFVIARHINEVRINIKETVPQAEVRRIISTKIEEIRQLFQTLKENGYDFNKVLETRPTFLFPEGRVSVLEQLIKVVIHIGRFHDDPWVPLLRMLVDVGANLTSENLKRIYLRDEELFLDSRFYHSITELGNTQRILNNLGIRAALGPGPPERIS